MPPKIRRVYKITFLLLQWSPVTVMYKIIFYIVTSQADLYMYNISDELTMVFKKHISKLLSWQQKRAGLMNHIMLQKMGLYYHTGATDIAPNTTVSAMNYGMEIS